MTPVITEELLTGTYIFNVITAAFLNDNNRYFVAIVFNMGTQHLYM